VFCSSRPNDIFDRIDKCADRDFLLRVSFVEIYNEVVKDLLSASDKGNNLKLREDPRKGVYVESKEEYITSSTDLLRLLHQGHERRTVGTKAMNDKSSRSHTIFRLVIESKAKATGERSRQSEEDVSGAVLVASLNLVDLAGSESMRHTGAEGTRQREAGNINKSLLTLSRVIKSLASNGQQNAPFRDSKLTRLLQNSLDGNTRTLIICCVTPSERYLEETKSTLQFAARAKAIQTSASVNEVLDDQAQLKRLKREVHELKRLVNSEAYNALKAENEALQTE
jgi:centromeric protein E